jgi:mRNA interferase HicA
MGGSGVLGKSHIVDKSGCSATGDAPTTFGAKRSGHANETRSQIHTTLGSIDLDNTTEVFSIGRMNSKQMKKWLEQQGATFQPGKGSHLKVFLNGKQSTLPMHGTAELGKGLEAAIKRQLGLK